MKYIIIKPFREHVLGEKVELSPELSTHLVGIFIAEPKTALAKAAVKDAKEATEANEAAQAEIDELGAKRLEAKKEAEEKARIDAEEKLQAEIDAADNGKGSKE